MAHSKKQREREILDEVYADLFEIEPHEGPDFLVRKRPHTDRFGVEITEFYLTEGQARLRRIEGYVDHLLGGGDVKHRDDYQHFEVTTVTISSKEGEIRVPEVPAIKAQVPDLRELARKVAAIITAKDRVHDVAPRNLTHINLIIRDRHGVLSTRPSREFCAAFCTTELVRAVMASRFREVYFVSRFKDGDAFVALKMVLTLKKMYTVHDFLVTSKRSDVFEDLSGFMRWFACYLSTIARGEVWIREEGEDLEVLYGNAGFIVSASGVTVRDYAEFVFPDSKPVTVGADWNDLGTRSELPGYEESVTFDVGVASPVRTGKRQKKKPRKKRGTE